MSQNPPYDKFKRGDSLLSFFASQKLVAENIIGYIFKKYKIKMSAMCHNG